MEKRFKALRVLSAVYKILAWIVLVLGILAGLGILALGVIGGGSLTTLSYGYARGADILPALMQGGIVVGIVGFLAAMLASGLHFLILYAVSEFILLALSIEENTRETAYYLRGEGSLPLSADTDTGVPLNS